jgi:hypothetical protein
VLPRFYRTLGSAIRSVRPHALLFVEPAFLHSAATPASFFLGPIGLADIVYAPHEYGTSLNDASGDVGDVGGPAQFAPDLASSERQAALLHAPLWIGEWGDVNTASAISYRPRDYVPDMLSAQDAFMIGSAYWTWTGGGWPYSAGIQRQLRRITPFAVAGRLRRMVTGEHSLLMSWTPARGRSLVSLPAGVTPDVRVLRGSVRASYLGGGWLAVSARPGRPASIAVTG